MLWLLFFVATIQTHSLVLAFNVHGHNKLLHSSSSFNHHGWFLFSFDPEKGLPPVESLASHLLTDSVPRSMLDPSAPITIGQQSENSGRQQTAREILQTMVPPSKILITAETKKALDGKHNNRRCQQMTEASEQGSLGDIMGGAEGLGNLALPEFSALERIVLTANGNLQRIISSYYNSPVSINVIRSVKTGDWVYDRKVKLVVHSQVFCVASSKVVVHSPACREALENGRIGIGQLYRHLDLLPHFRLLRVGREDGGGGGFYRLYDLTSEHLSCRILEEYPGDMFSLKPLSNTNYNDDGNDHISTSSASGGPS